eukprot:10430336-Karenia_brevis.AAC.1
MAEPGADNDDIDHVRDRLVGDDDDGDSGDDHDEDVDGDITSNIIIIIIIITIRISFSSFCSEPTLSIMYTIYFAIWCAWWINVS